MIRGISDRPLEEWETSVIQDLNLMEQEKAGKVRGYAMILLMEDGSDYVSCNRYFRCGLQDKQMAAALIQQDITRQVARDAIEEYMGTGEE